MVCVCVAEILSGTRGFVSERKKNKLSDKILGDNYSLGNVIESENLYNAVPQMKLGSQNLTKPA